MLLESAFDFVAHFKMHQVARIYVQKASAETIETFVPFVHHDVFDGKSGYSL